MTVWMQPRDMKFGQVPCRFYRVGAVQELHLLQVPTPRLNNRLAAAPPKPVAVVGVVAARPPVAPPLFRFGTAAALYSLVSVKSRVDAPAATGRPFPQESALPPRRGRDQGGRFHPPGTDCPEGIPPPSAPSPRTSVSPDQDNIPPRHPASPGGVFSFSPSRRPHAVPP